MHKPSCRKRDSRDMGDFAAMNEVYASFFTSPFPARSAVAVKTLPKGALVEIECIAEGSQPM